MAKIKFTNEELNLLKSVIDIEDKSKSTVLEEFENRFHISEPKSKWFDTVEEFDTAYDIYDHTLSLARNIIRKLNCMNNKEWIKSANR